MLFQFCCQLHGKKKIVDLNKEKLKDDDIVWADYIVINAKEEQYKSTVQTIEKCKLKSIKIIGSGSLFYRIFRGIGERGTFSIG